MATLRDSLLPVFQNVARKIPQDLGLRTNTVYVRNREWSGGDDGPAVGMGTSTTTDLLISPKPKLKYLPNGNIETVVTPAFPGGGYTPEQVNPLIDATTEPGREFVWVIQSPDGEEREYRVIAFNQRRAFGYYLTLEPLDRKGVF